MVHRTLKKPPKFPSHKLNYNKIINWKTKKKKNVYCVTVPVFTIYYGKYKVTSSSTLALNNPKCYIKEFFFVFRLD